LKDRRSDGASSCNPGDGTDQRVQSLMFILMMMNNFEKFVHLVGFIISVYHDARSPERQIHEVILTIFSKCVSKLKIKRPTSCVAIIIATVFKLYIFFSFGWLEHKKWCLNLTLYNEVSRLCNVIRSL